MAAVVKPVNATIAPRPKSENGGYVICSITFKPVNPQFKSPSDDPYMAARPFTASMNGKFGPGGGSSDADAECRNLFRFGLIGKNCNRRFNALLFILF